jgi:hypothetical protein
MSAISADLVRSDKARTVVHDVEVVQSVPVNVYRNVSDVRLLQSLSIALLVQSVLLVVSFAALVVALWRPPKQIIIERSGEGDRVVAVNGQSVKNGIAVGDDKPGSGDKKTLAREWSTARYAVDPLTREKDIEKMFRAMDPNSASKYNVIMLQQGVLKREVTERWSATWAPQLIEVDRGDPYLVNVMGLWEITRNGAKGSELEQKQLVFKLRLRVDDQGRAPRNLQTGFLVEDIVDYRELPVTAAPQSALKPTP